MGEFKFMFQPYSPSSCCHYEQSIVSVPQYSVEYTNDCFISSLNLVLLGPLLSEE